MKAYYSITKGEGAIVAAAIHNGHRVRETLRSYLNLEEDQRLREEDPYTAGWTTIVPSSIIFHHSRFEVDVNRPREQAVYQQPEDAWGLEVWEKELPPAIVDKSLRHYDAFYHAVKTLFDEKIARYGYFILYDLHTYNHRREGPAGKEAEPKTNPEINVGTKHMDRKKWSPVVDNFMNGLQAFDYSGRSLDVRENIKFKGGYFSNWVYETYRDQCCAMAIEVKKFFMDEWTGQLDRQQHDMIREALHATLPGVLDAAASVKQQLL